MPLSLNLKLGRRSGADVVGLDIQPGLVAAVRARVNGEIVAEHGAVLPLPSDTVREGDVVDQPVVSETLRELFAGSRMGKRVRVGVANQRTVMRTLELPPLSDRKELAAAVRFQAQDQVPMPLTNAVLDFHPLGVVDTPGGPRQKVVLVAAQRDMIERLLAAVRGAGLTPVGVDLSAFALIRSLYRADDEHAGRVLYLNVDGLTNVAIAEGKVCRFTRVVGGGLEEMAAELAERRGFPLSNARALLARVDLRAPLLPTETVEGTETAASEATSGSDAQVGAQGSDGSEAPAHVEVHESREPSPGEHDVPSEGLVPADEAAEDADARAVLEHGVRAISGEVRNSLDFHRSQEGGGDVTRVVLSGLALELPGFADALQSSLGVEVHAQGVGLADAGSGGQASANRLAIAAGLAVAEAPQ
jgi:type IV pilus assembly protein PilM